MIDTDDQVTITDWYLDQASLQLDEIEASDGFSLTSENVDKLVSGMSTFDMPSGTGGIIPEDVENQLAAVMADTWVYF